MEYEKKGLNCLKHVTLRILITTTVKSTVAVFLLAHVLNNSKFWSHSTNLVNYEPCLNLAYYDSFFWDRGLACDMITKQNQRKRKQFLVPNVYRFFFLELQID